jgi:hypothetical protein
MRLIPQLDNAGLLNSVIFIQYGHQPIMLHARVCVCVCVSEQYSLQTGQTRSLCCLLEAVIWLGKINISLNTTIFIRQYGLIV